MACSQCVGESRRSELRRFWQQISPEDKRQFATGGAALAGAAAGWGAASLLGGLVGLFLGGCAGGIAGLARYKDTASETEQAELLLKRAASR